MLCNTIPPPMRPSLSASAKVFKAAFGVGRFQSSHTARHCTTAVTSDTPAINWEEELAAVLREPEVGGMLAAVGVSVSGALWASYA